MNSIVGAGFKPAPTKIVLLTLQFQVGEGHGRGNFAIAFLYFLDRENEIDRGGGFQTRPYRDCPFNPAISG
jgi:hypothetical protein